MGSRTSWQPVEQAIRRIVVTVGALLAPAACRDSDERSAGTTAPPTSRSTDTAAPSSTSMPSTAPRTTPPWASIAAPTTATTEPSLVTPVWTTALAPASSLAATGDVVAFYAATPDERLEIVALGAADGAERWRHPAAVSEIYIGIAPAPVALADQIVALAPRSDGGDGTFVTLHGYDPATGEIAWVSEPLITRNGPGECDDGLHVCLIGYLESDPQTARDLRFDPASGALVASTHSRSGATPSRATWCGFPTGWHWSIAPPARSRGRRRTATSSATGRSTRRTATPPTSTNRRTRSCSASAPIPPPPGT